MNVKVENFKKLTDIRAVSDVKDFLEQIGAHGDRLLFKYFENGKLLEMSYAEFLEMITNTAAGLSALGLTGKRIAVIGETSPQWIATYIAALANGTVIIPMDKELALPEIKGFLEQVEAEAIVYSATFNTPFSDLADSHPTVKHLIPIAPDENESDKKIPFSTLIEKGKAAVGDGYTVKTVENREEMCEMLFTSGTTGTSKCVMLCQKNIFAAVTSALDSVYFVPDDVIVSVLPVHHTYELMCLLSAMTLGMTICINDSLRHVLQNFARFKPTGLVLVPLFMNTMYKKIWSEAEKTGRAKILKLGMLGSNALRKVGIDVRRKIFKSVLDAFGGRLKKIICGGAKLNPELIYAFESLGVAVFEGFGITECSPLVSVDRYYARKPGSIGPAVSACSIMLDKNGETTEDGYDIGEILVKGDNVMLGYYNNPKATAEAFTEDGWFRTGDVGYLDSDGYIYITGRSKFVIVLENGKNVFPEEIESYLENIKTIAESCVIGRKAPDSDEIVLTAVIYPNYDKFSANVTDDEVRESLKNSINALNKTLPVFKRLKAVEIRKTEFEKTTTKKIKRQLVK